MKFSFFKSLYQPLPLENEEPEEDVRNEKESETVEREVISDDTVSDLAEMSEEDYLERLSADTLPLNLLNRIVDLINSGLPEFIRSCIDVEAEKTQVYARLKDPLSGYLKEVVSKVKSDSAVLRQLQQSKLDEVTESMNKRIQDLEKERDEIQTQQLSTERQKRTLTERTHELEGRITMLETEKEKIDEVRRQISEQLRKANVQIEQLTAESENWSELQNQLKEANGRIEMFASAEEQYKEKILSAVADQNAWHTREADLMAPLTEKEVEIGTAVQRISELEAELNRIRNIADEAKKQLDEQSVNQAQEVEEITLRLAKSGELLTREKSRVEELETALSKKHDLENLLADLEKERDDLARRLAEKNEENDSTLQKLTEENNRLERQLSECKGTETENKSRMTELERALIEASHENETLEKSIRLLEEQLDEKTLTEENKTLVARVSQLQSLVSDMQMALESRSRECEELGRELKTLQKENESIRKKDLLQHKKQTEEIDRLKHELLVANDIHHAIKVQRKNLLADNEKLQQEKEALRKELDRLEGGTSQIRKQKETKHPEGMTLKKSSNAVENASVSSEDPLAVDEDVLDWLVPTRLETPEEREARFAAERQLQLEQEQREREQREKERERFKNSSTGQMSLW